MPILSQFGAPPAIVEDKEPLYQEAAANLLTGESDDNTSHAITALLKHLDNNLETATRLLAEMLSFREQWLPHIGLTASIAGARTLLEKGLQTAILDNLHKLLHAIPNNLALRHEIVFMAQYAANELAANELSASSSAILSCRDLQYQQWPGQNLEDLPLWLGIAELLLTEENTYRQTITQKQGFKAKSQAKNKEDKIQLQSMKQRMLDVLNNLAAYPDFREALEDLRHSPLAHYTENEWDVIDSLVTLLPALVAELTWVFQKTGQVDFAEVLLAASRAMGYYEEPSDLALRLDNQIRHILVDEFQDISIPQLKLLEQLIFAWEPGDGRSLFLVGDPQQSIYRFRQAEVGLFLQVKEKGIGTVKLKPLTLTTNFRSSSDVVNWVNQYFSKAFPKQDEIGTGAIAYSPSVAVVAIKSKNTTNETINNTLNAIVEESIAFKEVNQESEAQELLEIIHKVKEKEPLGSIALLVRSRNHLKNLIPLLKQAGQSYHGVDIEPLKDKALLQDLLSLTKALLHLGDKVAWLSLLRSPYCCVSLNDLFLLANHEVSLPLWWTLQSYQKVTNLSNDAINKLSYFVPCLQVALADRDRYPLSVWVKNTWLQLRKGREESPDYQSGVLQNEYKYYDEGEYSNSIANEQIQETFFAILEEKGYAHDFYDITVLENRLEALYAKSNNLDPNAVQIMTIHKSKGLEFDTVIVAGIGRTSRSDTEKLLLWESRASLMSDPYIILAPIKPSTKEESKIYAYLKNENKKRAHFEEQRLLYVASTRAKKRLFWLQHE